MEPIANDIHRLLQLVYNNIYDLHVYRKLCAYNTMHLYLQHSVLGSIGFCNFEAFQQKLGCRIFMDKGIQLYNFIHFKDNQKTKALASYVNIWTQTTFLTFLLRFYHSPILHIIYKETVDTHILMTHAHTWFSQCDTNNYYTTLTKAFLPQQYSRKIWQGKCQENLLFSSIWQMNRSAKRLSIVSANLNGFSLGIDTIDYVTGI